MQNDDKIEIHASVNDSAIFNNKLELDRIISCSTENNKLIITDKIKNCDVKKVPFMLLYHMNIGYPLLDEDTELYIPSADVTPRDKRAAEGLGEWNKMLAPQAGFVEQCYYHTYKDNKGCAMVFNKNIGKGLAIHFDASKLDNLIEWKMMGERDYVLGLEPSNSMLDGRKTLRENDTLKYLEPGEEKSFTIEVDFYDDYKTWNNNK